MVKLLVTIFVFIPTLAVANLPEWVEKGLDENGVYRQELLIAAIRSGFKNLEGAYLKEADLSGANLENINFENANLQFANFTDANLAGAKLREAVFNDTNFTRACLQNASFKTGSLKIADKMLIFPVCILTGLDKNGVYKQERLIKAIQENGSGDFTGAYIKGADLKGIHLERIKFNTANLINVNLSGAKLKNADLRHASLTWANLKGADLEGADLKNANLTEANLEGANLKNAKLKEVNFEGANLTEASLKGVNLEFSNLEKANLTKADLEGASLKGVNLIFSNLEKANLAKADLEGAGLRIIKKNGLKKSQKKLFADLMDIYKAEVMARIQKNWAVSFQRIGGYDTQLNAILVINIKRNGYIQPDMWFEKKSGNEYFDECILKAVKKSNPLPPLPDVYRRPIYGPVGLNFLPSGLK